MNLNPLNWPFRAHCALGVLACAGLWGYALYVQHVLFIDPCPLCILQRVAFLAIGGISLLGLLHGPRSSAGRAAYGLLATLAAVVGGVIAGQHVRLQNLPPDQVPACGPGLNYMLDSFPLLDALAMAFRGSGECAEIDWTFAGLSMPGWTLICFVLMAAAALYAGFKRRG